MSIRHHLEDAVLLSYASGAADEPTSLVIATHLALCGRCRAFVADAERAGGALLERIEPVASGGLEAVLARLDGQERPKAPVARAASSAPEPLRSYLGGDLSSVRWRKIASGIAEFGVLRRGRSVARLLKGTPGTAVSEHTHAGEEITLILTGGLGDHTGEYHRGDVQSMSPADTHEPRALPGEDCIVLATTSGPLKFSSLPIALLARLRRF